MATTTANGRIAQVIGSTFDADFDEARICPDIYNRTGKIETEEKGVKIDLTGECGNSSSAAAGCAAWPWARPTGWCGGCR